MGCPLLFVVPEKTIPEILERQVTKREAIQSMTERNTQAILGAVRAVSPDVIFAVDCGGDSLTGGIDFQGDVECGRDRQVLRGLKRAMVPVVHMLLAPGCDGESTVAAMETAVAKAAKRGAVLGQWSLDEEISCMQPLCAVLSNNRTPNLMRDARDWIALHADCDPHQFTCKIERHGHTARIPWGWMVTGIALDASKDYL